MLDLYYFCTEMRELVDCGSKVGLMATQGLPVFGYSMAIWIVISNYLETWI